MSSFNRVRESIARRWAPATIPPGYFGLVVRHYSVPILLLAFAAAYGVLGYWLVAGWSLGDALYMTVIALSTVGFEEVRPLSGTERQFTISLILIGVGAVFTAIGLITEHAASGELGRELRRIRVNRQLKKLDNHIIVCGCGRVGREAVAELIASGASTLVIDQDPDLLDELPGHEGAEWLTADATHEAVLERAGIRRARGLVTAIGSDAVNVYITLTARILNPDINVVALATDPESRDQLLRAGADRVTSLSAIGGHSLASHALHPNLADFIELSTASSEKMVQEVTVLPGSSLVGRAISDLPGTRTAVGPEEVAIVGLKREGGEMRPSPPIDSVLGDGDTLIVWGTKEARDAFLQ